MFIKLKLEPSSNILGAEYDAGKKELLVTFRSGGIYKYFNVDEKIALNWLKAESAGKYFNEYIRIKEYIKHGKIEN